MGIQIKQKRKKIKITAEIRRIASDKNVNNRAREKHGGPEIASAEKGRLAQISSSLLIQKNVKIIIV